MGAYRRFDLVQAEVNGTDLVAVEGPMAALALENIELTCVGIECEAVQVCLAASHRDFFLVSLPVGQLVDRKYQCALNKKAVPLLDTVDLRNQRRQTRVRSK